MVESERIAVLQDLSRTVARRVVETLIRQHGAAYLPAMARVAMALNSKSIVLSISTIIHDRREHLADFLPWASNVQRGDMQKAARILDEMYARSRDTETIQAPKLSTRKNPTVQVSLSYSGKRSPLRRWNRTR
jgi:hypothetical protein